MHTSTLPFIRRPPVDCGIGGASTLGAATAAGVFPSLRRASTHWTILSIHSARSSLVFAVRQNVRRLPDLGAEMK